MANEEHLNILSQGVDVWNAWMVKERHPTPDLSCVNLANASLDHVNLHSANLTGTDFSGAELMYAMLNDADFREAKLVATKFCESFFTEANLSGVNLTYADFSSAQFLRTDLRGANLMEAILQGAYIAEVNLRDANLSSAYLFNATFIDSDLRGVNLCGANLTNARLINVDLSEADLSNCVVYGISVWDVKLDGAKQANLVITPDHAASITVDNLEVAQFIYLLLNNQKMRDVINTITSKAVLILGRFTPERKAILEALREELRRHDLVPILFDFEQPDSRNLTETISALAHMSRFVIADLTDAKSLPQELQRIIPDLPSLPVQPLILSSQYEYAMFKDFLDYPWVLAPYRYDNLTGLLGSLEEKVITPAAAKAKEIEERRKAFEGELYK